MILERIANAITKFIFEQIRERNSNGIAVGLSGGIDSSVVAHLSVMALGRRSVLGVILPESNITPEEDLNDAKALVNKLGIEHIVIEIDPIKTQFMKVLPDDSVAQGNLAARIRMCILYYYAALKHLLVAGTADKSEMKLGYYTKHGDGAADIFPIADLYKTEVRQLASYLRISPSIINKKSRPGLWHGHTAEEEIGLSYENIDNILQRMDTNSLGTSEYSRDDVRKVSHMVEKNRHKRERPVICKIHV
jgi:NAD+ synthase